MTQRELKFRAIIAGDLFVEGKILRHECFRLEVDAALGENTGTINYVDNTDYEEQEM